MNMLITRSLEQENVNLLFNFPTVLMSEKEVKMVEWIMSYVNKYGSVPNLARLTKEFDTFIPVVSTDPLGDIYDQTLIRKRNRYTREFLVRIQDDLKKGVDPLPYISELHQQIQTGASDVVRYTRYDRTTYYRRPTSFPYGIKQIDDKTGGIAAGDLVYLIGRLGTGKTTFALWVVKQWLLEEKRILMVSNENRADDVIAKVDSYIGGFNPLKKRTMQWTLEDKNRMETVSYIAQNMAGEMFIPARPVQDVKEVRNLITAYRPDIVVVDGIYLMSGASGDSHWEKITSVSRSLKQVAEGEGLPVLGIHQANRNAIGKRIDIEHIAYADALAQDADLLLTINPEEDGSVFVESIKNRWGEDHWGFFLKFFFDSMSVKVMDARLAVKEEL